MVAERIPASMKKLVEERAAGCCEYCRSQARFAMQAFSAEHIKPRSLDGPSTPENLAFACQGCNNHKYDKTQAPDPVTGEMTSLFNPRLNRWREHFAWSPEFSLIVGLTALGRTTVEALQLNRTGLVNLRKILYAAGEHPPRDEGVES